MEAKENITMETKDGNELKALVREKYARIAEQSKGINASSCCGAGQCGPSEYTVFSEDYSGLEGYAPDADLGLGCGLPTEFAGIKPGDTVVDLGSGAGNDCFIARSEAGEAGKIIGIDMTEAMILKARSNAEKLGYKNVEFIQGDIEALPLSEGVADVVVSNCVLNLVPDKRKAFSEIHRVLRKDGHFSISDVVLKGELPESLKQDAEMYAGCVAGALQMDEYMGIISDAGFSEITVQKQRNIDLPEEILKNYLTDEQIREFEASGRGILSITVYGKK